MNSGVQHFREKKSLLDRKIVKIGVMSRLKKKKVVPECRCVTQNYESSHLHFLKTELIFQSTADKDL